MHQGAARTLVSAQAGPRLVAVSGDHGDDRQLARRVVAGEASAVEEFGERFGAALYRFAAARLGGDRELTRDLVQATLTRALQRLHTYRGEAALLTWLCACCRNEILMHRRRLRTAPVVVELTVVGDGPGDPARDPEAALLARERSSLVHVTLDTLAAHYAQALEWKYVDHQPVEEIASRLGVGLKAAESLLGRARAAFRQTFQDLLRGEAMAQTEDAER